jgi:hypothetical protein
MGEVRMLRKRGQDVGRTDVRIISAFLHPQPLFSSWHQASAVGGDEGRGAADEFRAEMRMTRFRYPALFFNK